MIKMTDWRGKILEKAEKILKFIIDKTILYDVSIATFAFALLFIIQHFSRSKKKDDEE